MKALVDTNVVLDVLLARKPHAKDSAEVFRIFEMGQAQGVLCATTLTTLDYLLSKSLAKPAARHLLSQLLKLFEVASVNRAVIEEAMASPMKDFEDAVLDQAARHCGADVVVTRNGKDFSKAATHVMDPKQFVAVVHGATRPR